MQTDSKQFDLHPASVVAMLLVFVGPLFLLLVTQQPLVLFAAVYLNLAALSFYDFREYRLPNILNTSFFMLAVLISYVDGLYAFHHHVIGAMLGAGIPIILNVIYKHFRGREGIGMGDVKMLAGTGMLLGWFELPLILSISSTLGIAYILFRYGLKKTEISAQHIPFGPFIAFATITLWLLK